MPPKRSNQKKQSRALNALRIASQHLNQRSNVSALAGRKLSLAHPALSDNYWKTLWTKRNLSPNFIISLVGALYNQEIRVRQIPPHILQKLVTDPYAEDFVMVVVDEYPDDLLYILKTVADGNNVSPFLYIQAVTHAAFLERTDPTMHKILKHVLSRTAKDPNMLAKVVSAWIYHTHGTPRITELFAVISKLPKSNIAPPATVPNTSHIRDVTDQVSHLYLKSLQHGPLNQNPTARDTMLRLLRSIARG